MVPCFFIINVTPKAPIHTSIQPHYLNSNTPWHHIPPAGSSSNPQLKHAYSYQTRKGTVNQAIKYDHV